MDVLMLIIVIIVLLLAAIGAIVVAGGIWLTIETNRIERKMKWAYEDKPMGTPFHYDLDYSSRSKFISWDELKERNNDYKG